MVRVTLIEILLVSLPFIMFVAYRMAIGSRRRTAGGPIDEGPYQLLFFSGAALSLIVLVVTVLVRHYEPVNRDDLIYMPHRSEDGRIVRGEFITREEARERGLLEDNASEPNDEANS